MKDSVMVANTGRYGSRANGVFSVVTKYVIYACRLTSRFLMGLCGDEWSETYAQN